MGGQTPSSTLIIFGPSATSQITPILIISTYMHPFGCTHQDIMEYPVGGGRGVELRPLFKVGRNILSLCRLMGRGGELSLVHLLHHKSLPS